MAPLLQKGPALFHSQAQRCTGHSSLHSLSVRCLHSERALSPFLSFHFLFLSRSIQHSCPLFSTCLTLTLHKLPPCLVSHSPLTSREGVPLMLRQDSKKAGKFLGEWNGETETNSWANWLSNLQSDRDGHQGRKPWVPGNRQNWC